MTSHVGNVHSWRPKPEQAFTPVFLIPWTHSLAQFKLNANHLAKVINRPMVSVHRTLVL